MFPDGKHDDQSVGHATMLISVIAGPHVEKPADASPAQGTEQQSGKLAPADAPTRAANEAIQISRSGAALPVSYDQINNLFHLRRDPEGRPRGHGRRRCAHCDLDARQYEA